MEFSWSNLPGKPSLRDIWNQPLDYQADNLITRIIIRSIMMLGNRYLLKIGGALHQIDPANDPFILALNHSQRYEAMMIPAILYHYRRGKLVHFLADWNFAMIPIVGLIYRHSESIVVTHKRAKPAFLNRFKRFYEHPVPAMDRALERLLQGKSVGIFPEGTVNRDPDYLMRGHTGAAMLSLKSGAPILPLGIRFPLHPKGRPIPDGAKIELEFGNPIHPPEPLDREKLKNEETQAVHEQIMKALAELSGKRWSPDARKRKKQIL